MLQRSTRRAVVWLMRSGHWEAAMWQAGAHCAAQQAEGIEDGKVGSTIFPTPTHNCPIGFDT